MGIYLKYYYDATVAAKQLRILEDDYWIILFSIAYPLSDLPKFLTASVILIKLKF